MKILDRLFGKNKPDQMTVAHILDFSKRHDVNIAIAVSDPMELDEVKMIVTLRNKLNAEWAFMSRESAQK